MSQPDKNTIRPNDGIAKAGPPEIKLPFEKKKHETGEWVYDNRVTVFVTVIIYLVIAISFVSARIVVNHRESVGAIAFDFEDPDKLQERLEEAKDLNRMLTGSAVSDDYFSDVRNMVSNENASVEQLHDNDRRVQEQLRESREMYEEGLREQQQQHIIEQASAARPDESAKQDVKAKGNVTVSFSLVDPIRSSSVLFVPAYLCEAGGKVVVAVTVNQNGDVTEANVVKQASSSDYCMTSTALDAAYRSRFNVDGRAPARHAGTITYMFVPQFN
jgi:TonB family protein